MSNNYSDLDIIALFNFILETLKYNQESVERKLEDIYSNLEKQDKNMDAILQKLGGA